MKSTIIIFISLLTYILTAVTITTVSTGTCTDKKYTFVINASTDATLSAGSATVTLASPASTTPTCTYPAVTVTSQQQNNEQQQQNENQNQNNEQQQQNNNENQNNDQEQQNNNENQGGNRRRLDETFAITCVITSKLDNAEIKVQSVTLGTTATSLTSTSTPVAMTGTATCEGTPASSDTTTPNGGKFIQISGFLFLLILTVF